MVPNITQHNSTINTKGCEAFVRMVEGQVQAFHIDNKRFPSDIDELVKDGYLKTGETSCPDGSQISLSADGNVTAVKSTD